MRKPTMKEIAAVDRSPKQWQRRAFLGLVGLGIAEITTACVPQQKPSAAPDGRKKAVLQCGSGKGSQADMDATHKEIAQRLVSSAENSSLDWRAQYGYIEDIGDGRGYTAGIIGFTSGTGDLIKVINRYTELAPGNALERFLTPLQRVNGSDSLKGLGELPDAWRNAAGDPLFQRAQEDLRDEMYFDPAVGQARADGLRALGQFCYYDAMVMHGPGNDKDSFGGLRAAALRQARPPAEGGNETKYLNAFLDVRRKAMQAEEAHSDTSRVDNAQRAFLRAGNLDLRLPLRWSVYGDHYELTC